MNLIWIKDKSESTHAWVDSRDYWVDTWLEMLFLTQASSSRVHFALSLFDLKIFYKAIRTPVDPPPIFFLPIFSQICLHGMQWGHEEKALPFVARDQGLCMNLRANRIVTRTMYYHTSSFSHSFISLCHFSSRSTISYNGVQCWFLFLWSRGVSDQDLDPSVRLEMILFHKSTNLSAACVWVLLIYSLRKEWCWLQSQRRSLHLY